MRRLLLIMLSMLMASSQLLAQNRTISGKVTDDKGVPLSNASVTLKGSNSGTVTSQDGSFTISVPANSKTLVISAVGMGTKEIAISGATSYDISLASTSRDLEEIVVVGYGTKATREVTGSVSKVSGEKIAEIPLPTFDQALAGKTAGVQINATGGTLADGVAIRIRGVNSISSSSQPLVVVDGIPQISLTNLNGFNGGDGTRFNPFANLNPNDIESIEVLKDAGASVIYGSRAANGVILITTKKGKRGTSKVGVEAKFGWSDPTKLPDLLNADDFTAINNEKAVNRPSLGVSVIAKDSDIDGDGKPDRTNWLDEIYRTGMTNDYSVSLSGGAEKASYYASGRYLSQEGISYGNRLRTGQARLNLDVTPKTWFKSGMELSYSKTLNNGILTDRYLAGSVTSGWQAPPNIALRNPNGPGGFNLTQAPVTPIGLLGWGNNVRTIGGTLIFPFNYYNPIAAVDLGRQNNTAEELRGNVYGEISPIRSVKLTTKFGVQTIRNIEDQFTSPFIAGLGQPYNGLLQNQDQNWRLWDWQNYISFDKVFSGNHKVSATAGAEYQKDEYFYTYTGAANFSDPFFQYIIDGAYSNVQPGTTTTLNLTGGDKTSSGTESYFGRLSYGFQNKYFIEGSVRRDAFSGFGEKNRWGTFPSVSAGWEVTKESFVPKFTWLDYLKIRGSYGQVGNSRGIGAYASRTLYGGAIYTINTGLGISQAGNAGLKWETSKKLNIGFDATFLNSRLSATVDYFKNNIDGLILAAPTLYTVGVPGSSISTNIGGMYNKGWEFTLNATPVTTKNFKWTSSFNFTTIKNEVTGLVSSNGNADINSGVNVASVGRPLSTYFLPRWAGVDPTTGNPMWYAKDGSIKRYNFGATGAQAWTDDKNNPVPALSSALDYDYLEGKQGLPTWYGGWDNNFYYMGVDLGISIMYQGGNYLYNSTRANMLTNTFSNNFAEIKNRWTKPGDVTDIPKLYLLDNTANQASDRWLEKGDFLRVRTISLGYTIPKSILSRISFDNIRLYGQIFNAFTLTKYSGADPEVNTNRFSNIAIGTDLRNVPQSRTITFGIQANF